MIWKDFKLKENVPPRNKLSTHQEISLNSNTDAWTANSLTAESGGQIPHLQTPRTEAVTLPK